MACASPVLRTDLSKLRPARSHRLRIRRRAEPAPAEAPPSLRELSEYNYFRRNVAGVQQEWWIHRSGCGDWFIAERDTRTNEVLFTALPHEVFGEGAAGGPAYDPPARAARRAHRARQRAHFHASTGKNVAALEGDTIGSALFAVRPAHLLAQLQVPPPARPALLRRPVPQLPRPGGRRARRARLHRAGARGDEGGAHERVAVARLRRDARHRPRRRPVHPARLLLQDLHPAAPLLAALREGAAARCGTRQAAQVAAGARVAHGVPASPRGHPRDWRRRGRAERGRGRGRARRRRGARRRGPRARRPPARRGRGGVRARARRAGARRGRRDPRQRPRARHLRRPRAGLAGRHAPPGPRARARSTPPARSSSRSSSPATTSPA